MITHLLMIRNEERIQSDDINRLKPIEPLFGLMLEPWRNRALSPSPWNFDWASLRVPTYILSNMPCGLPCIQTELLIDFPKTLAHSYYSALTVR